MLSLDSPQLELFNVSPALFVENQGQWADESVRFLHNGNGVNVAMTDAGPTFQILRHDTSEDADSQERRSVITGLDMEADGFDDRIFCEPDGPFAPDPYVIEVLVFSASFVDATAVSPMGLDRSEAAFNYFVGDQSAWRTDVPAYEKVVYKGIYDGIDLQTWGLRSSLKYEFHVAPGADFTQIQVRYDGIEGLQVNEDGSLQVALGEEWGALVDDAPYIYQMIDGDKVEVAGRFLLLDNWTYTFEVTGTFDPGQPLVIDPDLAWSTYLGGSDQEWGSGIAVDSSGDVVVTGRTNSSGWISGALDTTQNGDADAFVMKLGPTGQPRWATYVGGSGYDVPYRLALDSFGNVLITGWTGSSGWVSGGFDTTYNRSADPFVVKLSADGVHLWSTYLGGDNYDWGTDIAADSSGNVLVTGLTASTGWVSGGFDTTQNGDYDAFVVQLSPTGQHIWSTYLGGSARDEGRGIAVDSWDNILLTGNTASPGWISGGFDTIHDGDFDAFVAKLSPDGVPFWSTYLGGAVEDKGEDITVDGSGEVLVTGSTRSSGWVSGGFDTTHGGSRDGFVARLTTTGGHLWSTYLGGSDEDEGRGVTVDSAGNVWVTGRTTSSGWVSGGFDTTQGGDYDVFVAQLSRMGGHLWSTYLGGSAGDEGQSIAVDAADNVYAAGSTYSAGWTSGGFNTTYQGNRDAFIAKIVQPQMVLPQWSLYLGDTSAEVGYDLAVDDAGNAYVSGKTLSPGWTSGGFDTSYNGGDDAFVAKVSPSGQVLWSTYLGGAGSDDVRGVTVDSAGNVYVTGRTTSVGWISGGFDTSYNGGEDDGFVVKLDASGQRVWSTYLGGSGGDIGNNVTVDDVGNMYVAGRTSSSGWINGGFDTTYNGGTYDGFVVKLSASGQHLWSAYLGGNAEDASQDIAVDGQGTVYVSGNTASPSWTSGGFDTGYSGGGYDAFVVKLSQSGQHLWSTYLGGSNTDLGWRIATDNESGVFVAGFTESPGWPVGGFDTSYNGSGDAFVVKLNDLGQHLWSTYLGGTAWDQGWNLVADNVGGVFAAGATDSPGWTRDGIDIDYNGGRDVFVAQLNAWGEHVRSSYLGGTGADSGGIVMNALGVAYVAGTTNSPDLPRRINAYHGGGDAFVSQVLLGQYLNQPPVIGELVAELSFVTRPGTITLRAEGVSDADGQVACVEFYRGQGLLGADTDGSDGWSWSGGTADWAFDGQTFSARAQDDDGTWSPRVDVGAWVGDRLEVNNTWQTATDFGLVTQLRAEPDLNLHSGTDVDWFRFTLAHPGDIGSRIEVAINKAGFDIDAVLYSDSAGAPTPSSTPFTMGFCNLSAVGSCVGTLSLYGLPAGTYYVEVLPNIPDPDTVTGFYNSYDLSVFPPTEEAINWAQYLGGGADDDGRSVVVDDSGNVYVTGSTYSAGWVEGGFDTSYGGSGDAFVVKLSPSGEHLWSTYLGGGDLDSAESIAVDSTGNIYATGRTTSPGWTSGGFDASYNGAGDAFVVKLSASGQHLWSTYLGGSDWEFGAGIAVDQVVGDVYVSGGTGSSGWVSGGFDTSYNGIGDAFVAKLTASGQFLWGTYLGGTNLDYAEGVATFGDHVFVTGTTYSAGWSSGGFDTSHGGGGSADAFVADLSPSGDHFWSTHLGGSEMDHGLDLVVNGAEGVYVTGETASAGWTSGGYDTWHSGYSDAFVVKLSLWGQHLWSTYIGGAPGPCVQSSGGSGRGIAVDGTGDVYVTGSTDSPDWTSRGFDQTLDGCSDAFVVKLSVWGEHLWSSYLGGSGWDEGSSIAVDSAGNMYVTGVTDSPDFPNRINAYQGGYSDAFVAKIPQPSVENSLPMVASLTANPNPVTRPGLITLTATGVTDPDGTVTRIEFYRGNVLLGSDQDGSNGWSYAGATTGWDLGPHTFYARAQDNSGAWSVMLSTTATVSPPVSNWADLVAGVSQIVCPGTPGPVYDTSGYWTPIVGGDEDTSFPSTAVMARQYGAGRVLTFGHGGFFSDVDALDNGPFLENVTRWLDAGGSRQIKYTTDHGERTKGAEFADLAARMIDEGYNFASLPGTITVDNLATTSVLLVGDASLEFTADEVEIVRQFVARGGGLWLVGLGWSWEPYHPGKTLEDYPMMQLAEPYSMRWLRSYITDPTNNYGGSMVFHTFYPDVPSISVSTALQTIRATHAAHPQDLPAALESNTSLRLAFTQAHQALSIPTYEFPEGHTGRRDLYEALVALAADFPESYAKGLSFDQVAYPTATWVRERFWQTWRDCLPLTSQITATMIDIGQLGEGYAAVLQDHGVILLDNLRLGTAQVDFIHRYLDAIPVGLHRLRRISVVDYLGTRPVPISLYGGPDGVNVFGVAIGDSTGNPFPSDVAPTVSDLFVSVVAHEVNHIVDANTIGGSELLSARRDHLIADAGNEPMNYLRSMITPGFFVQNPQEFFASIANQWFSDSAHTIALGLARFDSGYLDPINQALYFADVYSQGQNYTWFYRIDATGSILRTQALLGRDLQGRINELTVDNKTYSFELDQDGDVLGYFVEGNQPPVIGELEADFPSLGQVTLRATGVADSDGHVTRVEFYRDQDLLGTDEDGSDGWTWSGGTSQWPLGLQMFSARAQDDDSAWSQMQNVLVLLTILDRFEPNDTWQTATNLGTITTPRTESDLNIHSGRADVDWFRFTLIRPGDASSKVEVLFSAAGGPVDTYLYSDPAGAPIRSVTWWTGNGPLSLDGLAAGTYYIQTCPGGIDPGFNIGFHNSYSLSITPPSEATTEWARYLGGGADDSGRNIAVDGAGNVYVTGSTNSAGWVQGGFDTSYDGSGDAFVVKLSPSGEHLWSTYLGGSGIDGGRDIALDGAGNVYVIGSTGSAGWISGGFDTSYDGGYSDGFVVKLSPVGQHLWSTYLGGSGWDEGNAIVVSGWGTVYVAGSTASSGWISGGFDATFNGDGDAFVVSLNPLGQHLWSTYLGGTAGDFGQGVAVFGDYVLATGSTSSTGWTIGGFDTSYNGGTSDAFVVALAPFGSHVWSTYLGGSEWDAGFDLVGVVESDWETSGIYVTGGTNSAGWASGGYDTGHSGYSDAFVVKLSLEGQHLWSTYLGGAPLPGGQGSGGFGRGVAADGIGGIYLTGFSDSPDWVDGGFDTTLDGDRDAFVVKINASGEHVWSSYLGGSGWDDGFGIAVGSAGDMYVAGMTDSPDFPWHINTQQGANDAFVAKLRRSNGTLHAATVNSTLTITDIAQNGISNQLTVVRSGANLVLSDATERFVSAPAGGVLSPDERTLTIPLTLVTTIVVDLAGGDDLLTIDFSHGDPIPAGGLSYDGGDGADELTVLGGTFSTIVKAFDNASDGSLDLDDTSLGYVRLESVRIGVASVDDLVLNLPISPDSASLEDDGTTGNDFSRLRSTNASFVNTAFVNPTGSLTVNPGQPDDTIAVADLPDFDAGLSIGSEVSLFGEVTFAGAVRLAPNRNLLAYASGTIALDTSNSDLAASAAGGVTLTTERNVVLASGSSITTGDGDITIAANEQATPTTGGAFTGISLTGAAISTTGAGRIGLAGRGGTSGGGNNGIYVAAGSVVSGGMTGAVTIRGIGGASTGDQNYGVLITDSGSLITSKTGALLVEGTGGGVGGSGENYGVLIQQRATISSSDALAAAGVTVKGVGGNSSGTSSGTGGSNTGVYLLLDSHVTSSSGAVLVEGIGGGGAISRNNSGVEFVQGGRVTSTGTAASATVTVRGVGSNRGRTSGSFGVAVGSRSLITSNGGAVLVEGTGGGLPGELGAGNVGVFVWGGGAITSAGTESSANVTVKGSGGNTGGGVSENHGVYVRDANSQIASNGGAVLVEGTGGGAGNGSDNDGVVVASGIITSAATQAGATVTVRGFGGNLAGTGGSNHGVRVANANSRIASSGGNMHVVGTAGGGASSFGIRVESDGQITGTTGAPTITLTADSMTLLSSASINATSGAVVLQPYHAGTQIDLGGDDVLSGSQPTLGLTREELGRVAAAALTIGNATSDTIRLTGAIARPMATDVSLISGGAIVFDTGSFDTAGGDLLLVPGVGGVQPLTVNRDVTVDNLLFGSGAKLAVHINGTTVDGGYAQLNLAGTVDLTGVLLTLSGTYTPTVGDSFTIVNNDGSDPILGTFMGLPEGATILNFLDSGLSATISYVAGDGNDVVLEVGLEQGNQLPLVDMLTVVPDPIIRPDQITLTAEGVTDIDGQIVQVEFYRGQQLLGMDQNGGDGWTWTESTANWPLGEHTIFVRAQDNDGDWSEMVLAITTVYSPYTPIEFGPVPVFASRQQTFTVHNSGTSSMTIQPTMLAPPVSISLPNGSGNSDDWLIGAGATKSFLVTFAPTQDGPVEAALMLLSDDPSEGDYLAIVTGLAVDGWRNVTEPYDVDGNRDVTPLDVLLLINEINSNGSRMLTPRTAEKPGLPLFLDPTGDGFLTPGDVLAIINQINQRGTGASEGEAVRFEGNVWSARLVSDLSLCVAADRVAAMPVTGERTQQTIVRRTDPERKSAGTALASRSPSVELEGWLAGLPLLGERSTLNPFELEDLLSDLLSPEEPSVGQGRIV